MFLFLFISHVIIEYRIGLTFNICLYCSVHVQKTLKSHVPTLNIHFSLSAMLAPSVYG